MINKDDILARLQKGDSVDEIAASLADALNEAKKDYDKQEAAIQMERAKQGKKIKDLSHLVFEIGEYIGKYMPDSEKFVAKLQKMPDEDYEKIAKDIDNLFKTVNTLASLEFDCPSFKFKKNSGLDGDPIFDFIMKRNWLD